MPVAGSLRPRQGRFQRGMSPVRLPTLWYELGANIADFSDHPLWKLPNTYPMIRIDARQAYDAAGDWSWAYFDRPPTASEFAASVVNVAKVYRDTYGPIFQAVGKRLRYAMLLVGIDSPDCPLKLYTHPHDYADHRLQRPWGLPPEIWHGRSRSRMRRNRTTQGTSPKLGADILGFERSGRSYGLSGFFHHKGRATVRAWAEEAFAEAHSELVSEGIADLEMLLTDIEHNIKDYGAGYQVLGKNTRQDPFQAPLPSAWFEKLVRDYALQPQHHNYLLDGDVTFGEWIADRQTTRGGG